MKITKYLLTFSLAIASVFTLTAQSNPRCTNGLVKKVLQRLEDNHYDHQNAVFHIEHYTSIEDTEKCGATNTPEQGNIPDPEQNLPDAENVLNDLMLLQNLNVLVLYSGLNTGSLNDELVNCVGSETNNALADNTKPYKLDILINIDKQYVSDKPGLYEYGVFVYIAPHVEAKVFLQPTFNNIIQTHYSAEFKKNKIVNEINRYYLDEWWKENGKARIINNADVFAQIPAELKDNSKIINYITSNSPNNAFEQVKQIIGLNADEEPVAEDVTAIVWINYVKLENDAQYIWDNMKDELKSFPVLTKSGTKTTSTSFIDLMPYISGSIVSVFEYGVEFSDFLSDALDATMAYNESIKSFLTGLRMPEGFWNSQHEEFGFYSPLRYIVGDIEVCFMCGLIDGVLEELTGAAEMILMVQEIILDSEKRNSILTAIGNITWDDIKKIVFRGIQDVTKDKYSVSYYAGKTIVTVVTFFFGVGEAVAALKGTKVAAGLATKVDGIISSLGRAFSKIELGLIKKNMGKFSDDAIDKLSDVGRKSLIEDAAKIDPDIVDGGIFSKVPEEKLDAFDALSSSKVIRLHKGMQDCFDRLLKNTAKKIDVDKLKALMESGFGDVLEAASKTANDVDLNKIIARMDMDHFTSKHLDGIIVRFNNPTYNLIPDLKANPSWFETFDDILHQPGLYWDIMKNSNVPKNSALNKWANGKWLKEVTGLGKKFESETVLNALKKRSANNDYLKLKTRLNKNLDDYDMYSQVQLSFEPVTLPSGKVIDYFVADQVYVKWGKIGDVDIVEVIIIVENKLKISTPLTPNQNAGKAASELTVRSNTLSPVSPRTTGGPGINLPKDMDISQQSSWAKIWDSENGNIITDIQAF